MLQTKFMLIKSDQTKPQSPTRRGTHGGGDDSRKTFFLLRLPLIVKIFPFDPLESVSHGHKFEIDILVTTF